jgi:hypothetical protein
VALIEVCFLTDFFHETLGFVFPLGINGALFHQKDLEQFGHRVALLFAFVSFRRALVILVGAPVLVLMNQMAKQLGWLVRLLLIGRLRKFRKIHWDSLTVVMPIRKECTFTSNQKVNFCWGTKWEFLVAVSRSAVYSDKRQDRQRNLRHQRSGQQ